MSRLQALEEIATHEDLRNSKFFGAIINAASTLSATLDNQDGSCDIQYRADNNGITLVISTAAIPAPVPEPVPAPSNETAPPTNTAPTMEMSAPTPEIPVTALEMGMIVTLAQRIAQRITWLADTPDGEVGVELNTLFQCARDVATVLRAATGANDVVTPAPAPATVPVTDASPAPADGAIANNPDQ